MASEELEDRDREIERLQAELREARENLSDEKQHSDFMENLVAARHGAGWEQLTIDAANNVRESAERLLQEREMQVAGMVDALAYYATTRDCYVEKAEGVWLLAEKALALLPDVSKYRRLMEALSDWEAADENVDPDVLDRRLVEAYRALEAKHD